MEKSAQISLNIELNQLYITRSIILYLAKIGNVKGPRDIYELINSVERLLLCFVNTPGDEVEGPHKIYDTAGSSSNSICFTQLTDELIRHKLLKKGQEKTAVSGIIKIIETGISRQIIGKLVAGCRASKTISIIDRTSKKKVIDINIADLRNIEDLIVKNILDASLLTMRYCAFITAGNHWAISDDYFKYLYLKCGVRNEGFASIINTKAIHFPDAKFCSIFPDLEAKYGSLGSFFNVKLSEHPGNWTVNPPFTEEIINSAVDKVLSELSSTNKKIAVYMILPHWADLSGIIKLKDSSLKLRDLITKPGEIYFVMQNKTDYLARSDHYYVVLYNNIGIDAEYDKTLIKGLIAIKKFKPKNLSKGILGSLYSSVKFY